MAMTRSDFKVLANALANSRGLWQPVDGTSDNKRDYIANKQWQKTLREVSDALSSTYPNFDRARFVEAASKWSLSADDVSVGG